MGIAKKEDEFYLRGDEQQKQRSSKKRDSNKSLSKSHQSCLLKPFLILLQLLFLCE